MNNDITLVTATSSNHYKSLLQFLRSVPTGIRTIVYDIGLTETEKETLPCICRKFDFSKYPEFIHLSSRDSGAYAWKPCIVYDICQEFGGIVIWCDSGNIITDIHIIIRSTLTCGVYSSITGGTFAQWTHPSSRSHLPNSREFLTRPMRNAACIGIDWKNSNAQKLIYDWKFFALHKEIILPVEANRSNHRHDQSILTYLIYSYQFPLIDEKLGYTIHNDID